MTIKGILKNKDEVVEGSPIVPRNHVKPAPRFHLEMLQPINTTRRRSAKNADDEAKLSVSQPNKKKTDTFVAPRARPTRRLANADDEAKLPSNKKTDTFAAPRARPTRRLHCDKQNDA